MPPRDSQQEMPTSEELRARRARQIWLLVLGALIALVGWSSWPTEPARPPVAAEGLAAWPSPQQVPDAVEVLADPSRTALVEDRPALATYPEADLEHPYAFSLDVRLQDGYGLPVADAMVFLAPPMCGFALWPERSDAAGRVHLAWRARERIMAIEVAVMAWGVLQPIRQVPLEAQLPGSLAIAVQARSQAPEIQDFVGRRSEDRRARDVRTVQRMREAPGELRRTDRLDILCGRTQLLFRDFDCLECHDQSKVARYSTLARSGSMQSGLHPASRFADLRWRGLVGKDLTDREKALEKSSERAADRPASEQVRGARVVGLVRRADGSRAAQEPVVWRDAAGVVQRRTTTDMGGRYQLEPVGIGSVEIVAGGGSNGIARTVIATSASGETQWSCQLELVSIVTGVALDEQGSPLVDWRVELERAEGDWVGLVATDKDGRFRFVDAPGSGQCLLWPVGDDCGLPVVHGKTALVDATPITLALDADAPTRARVRVHVALPPGHERDRVDARLYQLDTGRVASMPAFGFEDAFELGCVPVGPYRVQVGAAGIGWAETGIFVVDGRGLWDLGCLHLPASGRVRLRLAAGVASPLDGEHAFYRRTAAVDVLVEYALADNGDVLLAGGEHVLLWRDASGLRSLAFPVQSAGVTELVVPPTR